MTHYVNILKSKIHRAHVTEANINYVGSITIDLDLIEASGLFVHEEVEVLNITNGQRFNTYVIEGARGSGVMCLNGAAARLVVPGDVVIVLSYASVPMADAKSFKAKIVFVDEHNKMITSKEQESQLCDSHQH